MKGKALALAALALFSACLPPIDNATQVKDLRVLGISLEPPELLAERCSRDPRELALFGSTLRYRALLADPGGAGREIRYQLWACASPADRTCSNQRERQLLGQGTTREGELELEISPGATVLPDGALLLQRVQAQDSYQGLGGLRLPLVLQLQAGEEQVYAQKLMVYSCRLFPEMKQNLTPQLPGLTVRGKPWGEAPLTLQGAGAFEVAAADFSALEEEYLVPSFELTPVQLKESWKVSWHATLGRFSPSETGGSDLFGQPALHRSQWTPPGGAEEQPVTFFAVVRDGRGGQSWLIRHARYLP